MRNSVLLGHRKRCVIVNKVTHSTPEVDLLRAEVPLKMATCRGVHCARRGRKNGDRERGLLGNDSEANLP